MSFVDVHVCVRVRALLHGAGNEGRSPATILHAMCDSGSSGDGKSIR